MPEAKKLIRIVASCPTSESKLKQRLGVSRATLFRLVAACRKDLEVDIRCSAGVFRLLDWGDFLNRHSFLGCSPPNGGRSKNLRSEFATLKDRVR